MPLPHRLTLAALLVTLAAGCGDAAGGLSGAGGSASGQGGTNAGGAGGDGAPGIAGMAGSVSLGEPGGVFLQASCDGEDVSGEIVDISLQASETDELIARGSRPSVRVFRGEEALLVWEGASASGLPRLLARLFQKGRWLPVETFHARAEAPVAAIGAEGHVTVAFMERKEQSKNQVVCFRERSPAGVWSPPRVASVTGVGWWQDPSDALFRVGVDAEGNSAILLRFLRPEGQILSIDSLVARRVLRGGHLEPATRLFPEAPGDIELMMAPGGEAVAVWAGFWLGNSGTWASSFSPSSGWGEAVHAGIGSSGMSAVRDKDGATLALAGRYTGAFESIRVSRFDHGSWGEPIEIGTSESFFSSTLAVSPAGWAAAVWDDYGHTCEAHLHVALRDPGGAWAPIAAPPEATLLPSRFRGATVGDGGRVWVLWSRVLRRSSNSCDSEGLYLSKYEPGEGWHPATPIDDKHEIEGAQISLSSNDRALLWWERPGEIVARWLAW